jgi:hypothetical protein
MPTHMIVALVGMTLANALLLALVLFGKKDGAK